MMGIIGSMPIMPIKPILFSHIPLAFSSEEVSGDFIPVKSVNISIRSRVLPRLRILSRKA